MKRVFCVIAGATMVVASLTGGAQGASAVPRDTVAWTSCPGAKSTSTVECATVKVPLDYTKPGGQTITLALNRIKGSASHDRQGQGVLLVNPGGPGASGIALSRFIAGALPKDIASRYDVVGFDPRGVGASEPALTCVDYHKLFAAPRPDQVPLSEAAQAPLLARAKGYADACGARWGWLLPHLTSENSARDMDVIREALGEQKISYMGYSYGTYLGALYATMYPSHVRRLVLDSVVDPEGVWYDANISQDYGFDRRHREFLAWVARHNDVYHLGRTEDEVSSAWYAMRKHLAVKPAGGLVGPSELDDIFTVGGYTNAVWPLFAAAFSLQAKKGQPDGLMAAYRQLVDHDAAAENNYAVYLAVQCRDAEWPRDWSRWQSDTVKVNAKAPFMAWPNAWYNAPCAFWPVKGGTAPHIGDVAHLPPMLLIQSKQDAATPYAGALRMRGLFPSARLVAEAGGNHGVSLSGNTCVDRHVFAYLRDATVPGGADRHSGRQADAVCGTTPEPRPILPLASTPDRLRTSNALLGQ
ncbi:alpha/beta hydrolase [Sphaerisporangium fuscum]|uniref:alpha/beta hydrolase n=1 Tax=Sphaerisporangium fuscum TaxID=2835868 RepID=UPI001BDC5314|nr:alpha/beta hydrolase [Sphaerisporangium fuscum]